MTLSLRDWLAEPATRDLEPDDPRTTVLRRDLLRDKVLLRRLYEDWYRWILDRLPRGEGRVLELGSGAGFLDEVIPDLITSEVAVFEHVRLACDGTTLPFRDGALAAVVMTNVFHHLPDVGRFLAEAARAVRPGGALLMVEPWRTSLSELVYRHLHHEPFDPAAVDWRLPPGGPLTGANGALPWIVLERDRERLEKDFPQWEVESIEPKTFLRYLASGGLAWRCPMPSGTEGLWRVLDALLLRSTGSALFAQIVLRRR